MIGFNLLSFEATYLWGPSKRRFEQCASGKTELSPDHKCSDFPCQSGLSRHPTHRHTYTQANQQFCFSTSTNCLFLCRQVLCWGQVFPKKQHDFVSNGLWGGPAERELRDAGSIVGISWQQQSAPQITQMDVLLHLEKDKRLSACLQYFLRPLYRSLRTLL